MPSKKIFTLLTLIMVLGLVFTACAKTEDVVPAEPDTDLDENSVASEEEVVELQMTVWGSNYDPEVYQARLDLAEQTYPNIKVELIYIPSDYGQKVQTMIAGGESPDILQLAEDVHGYSSKGQVIGLNQYIEDAGVDMEARYHGHGLVESYSLNGELYAMPDRGGSLFLYYNKDMFDAAGLEYPTKDWGWEEFLTAAEALTITEGAETVQYGYASGYGWWPFWLVFLMQNGGELVDDAGNPTFNSPENVEALQFYVDLAHKYDVSPTPEDYANLGLGGPDPLFAQGLSAMAITGFWGVGGLQEVEDINWDIAPLWHGEESATVPFGSGLAVSSDSEHPEEAFKIVEFLTSAEGQEVIVEMKQDLPTNYEVLSSDLFLSTEWSATPIRIESLVESGDMIAPLPLIPEWAEMMDIAGDVLSEVITGAMDVQTAADDIQSQLELLLAD